jgi:Tfp pilus assembly protein PilF
VVASLASKFRSIARRSPNGAAGSLGAAQREKESWDFEAHYNLAAMLQAKGQLDAAIEEYQQVVRLRPEDAAGNNALGAALVAAAHPEQELDICRRR